MITAPFLKVYISSHYGDEGLDRMLGVRPPLATLPHVHCSTGIRDMRKLKKSSHCAINAFEAMI